MLSCTEILAISKNGVKVNKIKPKLLTGKLPYPMQELLIWSVVINEPNLTKIFLVRCESGIQDRLMVATMYKTYTKILQRAGTIIAGDRIEKLTETKKMFLKEVLDILNVADKMSQAKSGVLIRRSCPRWGNLSIVEIASKSRHLRIFENCVFQRMIGEIWRGQIDWRQTRYIAYFFSIIPVIGWISVPIFLKLNCIKYHSNNAFATEKGSVDY